MWATFFLLGCARDPDASEWLLDDALVVQPSPLAPSARTVTWRFDRPVSLRGVATSGDRVLPFAAPLATEHTVPLVPLYADATWEVAVTATDARGRAGQLPAVSFTTDPLPPGWPTITLHTADPRAEGGYTLLPLSSVGNGFILAALDAAGAPAWLYDGVGIRFLETHLQDDGRLWVLHDNEVLELDWLGQLRRRLVSAASPNDGLSLDARGLHHELAPLDDGSWVTMTQEPLDVLDFPLSYDNPALRGPATLADDQILRFDPDSGEILEQLPVSHFLQRDRIGYDSLNFDGEATDYAHTNAVFPVGDDWVVSVRHQDALFYLDADRNTSWILANPANWDDAHRPLLLTADGPLDWPYHQHGVKFRDDHILCFDNGNYRASPFTAADKLTPEASWSRVVEYAVDPAARTVRQTRSLAPPVRLYSTAMGDADWLPGGNILATYAYIFYQDGVRLSDLGRGVPALRLVEHDAATDDVVWDLEVWADAEALLPNWQTYRSTRFDTFVVPTDDAPAGTSSRRIR